MKGLLTIVCFLFLASSSCRTPEEVRIFESLTMKSEILGQELKYSVVVPAGYFSSKVDYAVIYLLHGLGDDEVSWLEYGRIAQLAGKMEKDGQIDPMIYVMPQGYRNYYVNDFAGTFLYQDMFINELIPFIDSTYRTNTTGNCRATIGYSMGGFGALTIPLKNPEIIQVSVPLSISIRTDEQYMYENPSEWNGQWGRLFGAVDSIGESRLTNYYKQNCPLHILQNFDSSNLNIPRIYIDNGDDEQTLSYSNEALHVLMRDKNIAHEFRVRDGGHSFSYWRETMPNALRFVDDAFNNKPYRGDEKSIPDAHLRISPELISFDFLNEKAEIYLPEEYSITTRKYPVIYISGNISSDEKQWLSGLTLNMSSSGDLPPLILAFTGDSEEYLSDTIMNRIEFTFRVREGYRFRVIMGIGEGGSNALKRSMSPLEFTAGILVDAKPEIQVFESKLDKLEPGKLNRTWYYIACPDKGPDYAENSLIHTEFRTRDIYHEYRVSEGSGGFEWRKKMYRDALLFAAKKIHR